MSLDTATADTDTQPLTSTLVEQFAAKRRKLIDPCLLPNPAKSATQQRDQGLDPDTVNRYADAYRAGEPVPAIKLFIERLSADDEIYHYGDGHHRVAAARKAKLGEIECIIEKGTARDALLYAVGANAEHGLRRTPADMRHAVSTMLNDDEWKAWSNREIARRTRTSEAFVRTLRKELKAEVSEIKRKDGTTQKPRNASAKKPRQQDLFEPSLSVERERFTAVEPLLGCAGSGFEGLHEAKRAMIAAAYACCPMTGDDPGCIRDALQLITGRAPDTHLTALEKAGHLETNADRKLWRITPATRTRINEILRTAAKVIERTNPAAAPTADDHDLHLDADLILDDLLDALPDSEEHVYRMNGDGTWANPTRVRFATIEGREFYVNLAQQTGTDGTYESDDALWHADIEITGPDGSWLGLAGITGRSYLDAFAAAIKGLDLSGHKPGHRQALLALADGLIALNVPDESTPTTGENAPTTGENAPAASAGPEDLTIPEEPAKPAPPRAAAPEEPKPEPKPRALADRRIDKQREILQLRLLRSKTTWTGSDDEMLTLAMLVGVPTRRTAWIDSVKVQARVLFLDALRTELADRIRTGEAINARAWPQLPELCRLWDLDHQAIEIEAERAVPE